MKNIFVSYAKDQKNTAKRLVTKLETEGYLCWIEPRDLKTQTDKNAEINIAIANCQIMIMIISTNCNTNDELITQHGNAFDQEKQIIPFVISALPKTVTNQHFLNSHHWINAYEDSFDEATTNLLDLIQNNEEVAIEKPEKNVKKNTVETTINTNTKNYIYVAVSFLVLIIIGVFLFMPDDKNNWEKMIIGKWKLVDYKDNLTRNEQEKQDFVVMLGNLKQNLSLAFYEDMKFERRGFQPQPEYGDWIIDQQNKKLKLRAQDKTEYTDELTIESINDKKLVILVVENTADNQQVETKLSFEKL